MRGRWIVGALAACAAVLLAAAPVFAQTSTPTPIPTQTPTPTPKAPTVEGEVTGGLSKGSTLSFTVDATMPGGWEALHLVEIVVRSEGQELERMTYDIEDVQLAVGDQEIVVGTGGVATGEYLRVSGADVIVTTGGGNLSLKLKADVVKSLPEGSTFRLGVVDDLLVSTSVNANLAEPPGEGITWGTVVALIAAALFAGGFIGNLFASKRRPPARPSVYAAVQRRIEQERSGDAPASR